MRYEWLVASLLYTRPSVRALAVHGQQAVDRYGGLSGMTTLDSMLLAVLENDIPQVIGELWAKKTGRRVARVGMDLSTQIISIRI